jgi:hypothetical protein
MMLVYLLLWTVGDAGPYKISLLLWKAMQRFSSSHLNDKSKFTLPLQRVVVAPTPTEFVQALCDKLGFNELFENKCLAQTTPQRVILSGTKFC